MLSRVANNLYWMSRYTERTENSARLTEASLQLLLDSRRSDDGDQERHWAPVLQSTGDDELFLKLYPKITTETVTQFLVFDAGNPNSILSSISQARENARTVRDQLTTELWEEINRTYLFINSSKALEIWRGSPQDFFQEIKTNALLIQSLTDATAVRNEGWHFMRAGRFIERADQTSRLLDVRHRSVPNKNIPGSLSQDDVLGWSAVLRSCSAWDAYRSQYGTEVRPEYVVELLMLSDDFPRSVRFCVQQLNSALRCISGVAEGRFSNEADKLSGRLLAELQFSTAEDVFSQGMHEFIDALQSRLNQVGDALFKAYIAQHFTIPEAEELRQQEEQQQQTG